MKRYEYSDDCNFEKHRAKDWKREHNAGGFRCSHCKQFVVINEIMGTANRNHCNRCLWSKHVDETNGDRRATCHGGMRPIGLTFKHEGYNCIGEIMLIHFCSICQKISINRVARDDLEDGIINVFSQSLNLNEDLKSRLRKDNIHPLNAQDRRELHIQLYGKQPLP